MQAANAAAVELLDAHPRPNLLSPEQLCQIYPAVKRRTLKYWMQLAIDREVSRGGKKRTIPGNGLGPAIVRKGRLVFIDEAMFLDWLCREKGGVRR